MKQKNNSPQLSQEQKHSIDNYSKQIVTLKDTVMAIRKMPGMYSAGLGNTGFLSLIREIFQNCIDQVLDPNSPANMTSLYYNMNTLEVIASDNGMGFPFNDMIRMATSQHTSKNYVKEKGQYSSGLHGSGLKVVNALSTSCIIESYHYSGKAKRLELEEGYVKREPYDIPNKGSAQGSTVKFIPSTEILGELSLDWLEVYTLIKRIVSLTPLGTRVEFVAIDTNGVEHRESIVNADGIITELIETVRNPMCKPIIISEDNGEMKIDLAFVYDGGENGPDMNEKVTSFCNMCPTQVGPHISGTVDGICKWFTTYMNQIYLSSQNGTNKRKQKLSVIASDIKVGLNIMLSGACLEPVFNGQAKEILTNKEMGLFCKDVISRALDQWSKNNPSDLSKLARYFKDIAELRMKEEGEKEKIVKKYQANTLTGYPRNYTRPTQVKDEIIIVEGDSAGGTAKEARDPKCQGIFKIRGKIKSAFKHNYKEFMSNAEVQGIINVVLDRKEYKRNFDPYEDVPWNKIIFMADADIDGAHISTLLLRFFLLYMPQLLEAGKVYKAIPPLYGIEKDGKVARYITDPVEFAKFSNKAFSKSNTLEHVDARNGKLTTKDIILFLMNNEDYIYELTTNADNYAVNPRLLEMALFQYYNKTAYPALRKELRSEFRFMDTIKENNTLVYEGIIGDSNTLFVNDKLIKDCRKVLDIIGKNDYLYYNMNGEISSIYQIMTKFSKSVPSNIKRYKGLGEMDGDQLAVSTLLPNSDRMLVRYTLEDAKREIEIVREYESDKSKLFPLIGTVKREDLLD